jgi:hypothetical protein
MPSTSFTSPTTATNDTGIGTTAWTITSVTNCACPVDKTTSNYLEMTGYGFALPTGATISGIEATITCSSSGGGLQPDLYVQLMKSNSVVGTSKSVSPLATTTFGDGSDSWGTSWTEAEVEASGFGVAIWVVGGSNGNTVSMTGATIRITYTTGGGVAPGSSTSGHFLFTWVI